MRVIMLDRLSNAIKSHAANLDQTTGQVKFGTITSVNSANSTARVIIQPDGVLSGWLPLLSQWVGNGWGMVCLPQPGDQVVLVPQEGNIEHGIIIGRSFSDKQVPPIAPSGEFWLVHQTGSSIKLCNDGTIHLNGDVYVQGDIYDSQGSLAGLRSHYNSHIHHLVSNQLTSAPSPLDI
jgi:phage gp45-like